MDNTRVVLVTGASSGIGKAAAISFAQQGDTVVLADINEALGNEVLQEIKAAGGKALFIKTNVADWEAMEEMHQQIVKQYGRLDVAVNNAGISNLPTSLVDTSNKDWETVMSVNATSVFYGMKLQVAQMLKQGGGVIVNTASVAGLRGLPKSVAYTASKHAVVGITKTAAMEYAKKNIRINAICPVFTVTALFQPEMMNQISEGLSEKLKKTIPMRRFGDVQETADTILWLCSDKASFINGIALPIDGGMTA